MTLCMGQYQRLMSSVFHVSSRSANGRRHVTVKAKIIFSICIGLRLAHPALAGELLDLEEVERIFAQALSRAREVSPNSVVSVTDREGNVLGVCTLKGRPA